MSNNVLPFRRPPKAPAPRRPKSLGLARYRHLAIPALLTIVGVVGVAVLLVSSPWPLDVTLRHWAAAPNCAAARAVGLAPSRRGQPGYYQMHDADYDGIACEVWPRR